jgi:hypothetical protein
MVRVPCSLVLKTRAADKLDDASAADKAGPCGTWAG